MRSTLSFISSITFLFFFLVSGKGYSQELSSQTVSSQPKGFMMEARDLMRTNKNAQALEVLQRHGVTVAPKQMKERDSIVKSISGKFQIERDKMITEISNKEGKVSELKSGNDDIDEANATLTTNTILFFSILLGVIIFILLGRFRVLSKSKEQLQYSTSLMAEIEKESSTLSSLSAELDALKKPLKSLNRFLTDASPLLLVMISDKNNRFHKQARQLVSSSEMALQMVESRLHHEEELKVETDLNLLIEEASTQAYHAMVHKYPEFSCTLNKDLEKILPRLEVYPEDIRFVLFNLFENAFDAVWKKRSNSPKGYEPTVTVSSRKLPRFVQIRVKDNGIGIPEKAIKKVFEPFYSDRNSLQHPGLGLSESYRIITEKHKGELYIEADLTSSTDFIIRFPTVTIM